MLQVNDLSRSLAAFDPISTLVVVVEMSKTSWLVSGVVPGVERQPLKKLEPDATALLRLIAVVSHADRGAERRAQDDNDRGTGAQAADSAVAPGHDRRVPDGVELRPAA